MLTWDGKQIPNIIALLTVLLVLIAPLLAGSQPLTQFVSSNFIWAPQA